jgi:aspartokinase
MTETPSWVVHKFGGSSVADAQCIARVAGIVESQRGAQQAVVLSACKGVTDALLDLVSLAESQQPVWRERLAAVRERHAGIAGELLDPAFPRPNTWRRSIGTWRTSRACCKPPASCDRPHRRYAICARASARSGRPDCSYAI